MTGNDLSLVVCPQSPHHTDKKNEEKNKWYKQVARKKKRKYRNKKNHPKRIQNYAPQRTVHNAISTILVLLSQ